MVARLACRVFHPTSSLATACGMQTLIDLVGPTRVLAAWLGGLLMKLVGIPGGFYRLAGDQACLIDDITGTTPPYDQTIVLGHHGLSSSVVMPLPNSGSTLPSSTSTTSAV